MKIYRTSTTRGFFNEYEEIDGSVYIFSMSNMRAKYHGEGFRFWLDDAGSKRNVGHNMIRYKCDNGTDDSECIFEIPQDDSPIFLDTEHTDKKCQSKFKYEKQTLRFMEEFRDLLVQHWNNKISSDEFMSIVRLVRIEDYSIEDAVSEVLYQSIFDDIHKMLKMISDSNEYMKSEVTKACYYVDIEYVNKDQMIVTYAKSFIDNVDESRFDTVKLQRFRQVLIGDIEDFEKHN